METTRDTFQGSELRETLSVLLRRKFTIAFSIVIVTFGSLVISMRQTPVYSTSARVVIRPVIAPAAFQNSGYSLTGPLGLDSSPDSEAEIARSAVVADQVRESLGLAKDDDLPGTVSVRVVTDQLLGFTGASTDRRVAARLANTFAEEYLNYRRYTAERALRDLSDQLKKRLDSLQAELSKLDATSIALTSRAATERDTTRRAQLIAQVNASQAQRNELLFQLSQVRSRYEDAQSSLGRSTGGGEIVQPATLPTAPASPKPARDGALGLILGMILGVGLAFVRNHFDDKIRDLSHASRSVGVLVLSAIPRSRTWRKRKSVYLESVEDPGSPCAEAYRSLRQGLVKMGLGSEFKTLLITSGGPSSGKTTSASNLGVALARTGQRVVLVSADLRRPRLHEFFGVSNEAGLADVLAGRIKLQSVAATQIPNLWVVPSGPVPANPSELLDGARFGDAIKKIEAVADVVIIDGPPLVAGADATVLARHADSTLMLLPHETARARGASAAVDDLTKGGAKRIVAALTMATMKTAGYGKYGYGYGYESRPSNGNGNGNGNGHSNGHMNGGNGHSNGNGHPNGRSLVFDAPAMEVAVARPRTRQASASAPPAPRKPRASRPAPVVVEPSNGHIVGDEPARDDA